MLPCALVGTAVLLISPKDFMVLYSLQRQFCCTANAVDRSMPACKTAVRSRSRRGAGSVLSLLPQRIHEKSPAISASPPDELQGATVNLLELCFTATSAPHHLYYMKLFTVMLNANHTTDCTPTIPFRTACSNAKSPELMRSTAYPVDLQA